MTAPAPASPAPASLIRTALVLGTFSMAAAAILVTGNWLTADEIKKRTAEDLANALRQVVPDALNDGDLQANQVTVEAADGTPVTAYRATLDGRVTAVALPLTAAGYGGTIRLILGVDRAGAVLGVRVIQHSETPGLGDRIDVSKSDWITRFAGRSLGAPPEDQWAVKKDGGTFDQFSGATITPRVVVTAVRDGLRLFRTHRARLLD